MSHPTIKLAATAEALLDLLKADLPAKITAAGLTAIQTWTLAHPLLLVQGNSGARTPICGVDYDWPGSGFNVELITLSGQRYHYKMNAYVLVDFVPYSDLVASTVSHPSMKDAEEYLGLMKSVFDPATSMDNYIVPYHRLVPSGGGVMNRRDSSGTAVATLAVLELTAKSDTG